MEKPAELQQYVLCNGKDPIDEGSYVAAFHRLWGDLRAELSHVDAHVILIEAQRGEEIIKRCYETALQATAGSAVNDLLARQYAIVKSGHERLQELRDEYNQ